MKKFIAVLLTFTIVMTLGIPAFAAEETEPVQDIVTEDQPLNPDEVIKDIIDSDSFKDVIEDEDIDGEIIEDAIENEEYEVIDLSQKEYEKLRKNAALESLGDAGMFLLESMGLLLLSPAAPFLFFIPFAGPFMMIIPLAAPVLLLMAVAGIIASPFEAIDIYKNFEPEFPYEITE